MLIVQSSRSNSSKEVPSSSDSKLCQVDKADQPRTWHSRIISTHKLLMLSCLECWFVCSFLKFLKLFIVHLSMCTCMHVEVRKQLQGICSLLPACESLEPNSSLQACQEIPSLYELPYQLH